MQNKLVENVLHLFRGYLFRIAQFLRVGYTESEDEQQTKD